MSETSVVSLRRRDGLAAGVGAESTCGARGKQAVLDGVERDGVENMIEPTGIAERRERDELRDERRLGRTFRYRYDFCGGRSRGRR